MIPPVDAGAAAAARRCIRIRKKRIRIRKKRIRIRNNL